jgi:hypothetical protein
MIGASALVAAGSAILPGPFSSLAWALAAVGGAVVGDLQARSMRAKPEAFRSAGTEVDVRKAFMATQAGRLAVLGQWVVVPVLIVAAWWGGNLVAGALGGFAVFLAVRDLVALRAIIELSSPTTSEES